MVVHPDSSTGGELLDTVQPRAVIISSAYDSRYGHPTEEMLSRLAERSIPAYWTATHGDIVLTSDGQQVTIATQQAAPTDARAIRDGEPIAPGTSGTVQPRVRVAGRGVEAIASPDVMTDGGTATAGSDSSLVVDAINADAAGDDRENLNDEYIRFRNTGDEPLDLSGWRITDAAGQRYTVPEGVTLAPGATLTLHTGSGTDTDTDLYWDSGSSVWNNGGDTITVRTATGDVVLVEEYA